MRKFVVGEIAVGETMTGEVALGKLPSKLIIDDMLNVDRHLC